MPRLIDAYEFEMDINWTVQGDSRLEGSGFEHIYPILDRQPTVDAEPVRHGHWINQSSGYAFNFKCSNCGYIVHEQFISQYLFCPHCGAKMDEVEE